MSRKLYIHDDGATKLRIRVSHHPHGDWLLRVQAAVGDGPAIVLAEQIVSSQTTGIKEWLEMQVDLERFAGQQIELILENVPNDWQNEWAYWNEVRLIRP